MFEDKKIKYIEKIMNKLENKFNYDEILDMLLLVISIYIIVNIKNNSNINREKYIDNIHQVLQEYINLISDSINNPNSVELLIEIEKIFKRNK